MSTFGHGSGGLASTMPADVQMAALAAPEAMAGVLDQNGDMTNGLEVDMLPMNIDVDIDNPHTLPFNPATAQQPTHVVIPNDTIPNGTESTTQMTRAGAGPLPAGFGALMNNTSGSSALMEFTKRRKWSQRVIEELRDFLYILTPDARLLFVSPSTKTLTGYEPENLVTKFITDFIHPDDSSLFVREFHESIASGHPLRLFYRFKKADGSYMIFEAHGHAHLASEATTFDASGAAGFCRGFFMMARPYPTKNAALLDSFLEHKIENERLTRRIADLRREELEALEARQKFWQRRQEGNPEALTPSESHRTESDAPASASIGSTNSAQYNSMPPPAPPFLSNTALTQQNLDEANASSRPDSINDKMARYEGATHLESIEMLTGLRYRDGERSQGISTGDQSPLLIRGDVGIAIPVDKENRFGSDSKKKLKAAEEYVCTDCGTLNSPEWRKGPNGRRSLCNACGLRWAKKEKRRTKSVSGSGNNTTPTATIHSGGTV